MPNSQSPDEQLLPGQQKGPLPQPQRVLFFNWRGSVQDSPFNLPHKERHKGPTVQTFFGVLQKAPSVHKEAIKVDVNGSRVKEENAQHLDCKARRKH